MIAACPRCSARYRVEPERIGPEGARLRCARCEAVFRVRTPEARGAGEAGVPAPGPASKGERLVVIADPEVEPGRATAAALSTWGVESVLVHDGVEAMLAIQRILPKVAVLDAALPKMYGFQICEVLKRNESLRDIRVVLIGAIHAEDRYRRPPGELYGADVYLERPDLPTGLRPVLEGVGIAVAGADAAAGSRAAADPALEEERDKARRLARVIVSDVVLYNSDKFDAALREGNLAEALAGGLAEAREFFRQKVDARVADERDYLADELTRVARERGMKSA